MCAFVQETHLLLCVLIGRFVIKEKDRHHFFDEVPEFEIAACSLMVVETS